MLPLTTGTITSPVTLRLAAKRRLYAEGILVESANAVSEPGCWAAVTVTSRATAVTFLPASAATLATRVTADACGSSPLPLAPRPERVSSTRCAVSGRDDDPVGE